MENRSTRVVLPHLTKPAVELEDVASPAPSEMVLIQEEVYDLKLRRRTAEARLRLMDHTADVMAEVLTESVNCLLETVKGGEVFRKTEDPDGGVTISGDGGREARLASTALLRHMAAVTAMMTGPQVHQHLHAGALTGDQVRDALGEVEGTDTYDAAGRAAIREVALGDEVD